MLVKLCDFWPSRDDIVKDAGGTGTAIARLLDSMTERECSHICPVPGPEDTDLKAFVPQGWSLVEPPDIPGVPAPYHEPYALSVADDTGIDFSPLEERFTARRIGRARRGVTRAMQWTGAGLAVITIAAVLFLLGAGGVRAYYEKRLAPLNDDLQILSNWEARSDSITEVLTAKNRFAGRESIITRLTTDLQNVFPEGVRAEQIVITESSAAGWDLDLAAVSYSTGLIPELMKRLEATPGIGEVRMQYSEQNREGKGRYAKKVIRFKVTAGWEE
jgi:hypothetical protein